MAALWHGWLSWYKKALRGSQMQMGAFMTQGVVFGSHQHVGINRAGQGTSGSRGVASTTLSSRDSAPSCRQKPQESAGSRHLKDRCTESGTQVANRHICHVLQMNARHGTKRQAELKPDESSQNTLRAHGNPEECLCGHCWACIIGWIGNKHAAVAVPISELWHEASILRAC